MLLTLLVINENVMRFVACPMVAGMYALKKKSSYHARLRLKISRHDFYPFSKTICHILGECVMAAYKWIINYIH